jgi:hypothetical protein
VTILIMLFGLVGPGLVRFKVWTGVEFFWTRSCTIQYHKRRAISLLAERLTPWYLLVLRTWCCLTRFRQ